MLRWYNDETDFGDKIATNGCGKNICFEETNYIITPGSKAAFYIHYEGTQQPTQDAEIIIRGYKFKFNKTTDNNDPNEIYASDGSSTTIWLNAIAKAIKARIAFRDFNITTDAAEKHIKIESKKNQYIDFSNTDLNGANTGLETGDAYGFPEETGVEDIVKDDYYVFLRIIDNETGEPIVSKDFSLPLNVEEDGSNKVCFELSRIAAQIDKIKIRKPEEADPEYLQDNDQVKYYSIEVYGKYNDPDNAGNMIQTNVISVGDQITKTGYSFIRMIEQPDGGKRLTDYEEGPDWMTDKPEEYAICKGTPIQLRFHRTIHQFNGTGYTLDFAGEMTYADGSTKTIDIELTDLSVDDATGEVHIVNLGSIINNAGYFDQNKIFIKFTFKVTYYQSIFAQGDATNEYTIYFDNDNQGPCCEENETFIFPSESGNMDVLIARRQSVAELEINFDSISTPQKCGEAAEGKKAIRPDEEKLKRTVWIYCDEWEYLLKFLRSPEKYIWKTIDGSAQLVRVVPEQTTYQVYRANKRGRLKFTYYEGTIKNTF